MKNKKILYLLLTILLITFFGASYSLAYYINKNDLKLEACDTLPYLKLTTKNNSDKEDIDFKQASVTTNVERIAENTKFIFKIKYKDKEVRNLVMEKYYNDSSVLNGKKQVELNEFFKSQGYIVENMGNNETVFVNNSDRYSYKPNRYFLGVYNDMVTIYKTDKDGNIAVHKLFNSNEYEADEKYDFESQEKDESPQCIKIEDLKEKDGVVEDLIWGRKHNEDSEDIEENLQYETETGEFKTPGRAFDYARGLLKS